MDRSPAARAIFAAGAVVAAALGVYVGTAVADLWPALTLAALGATLGAGVAINAIVARDVDDSRHARPVAPAWIVGHQAAAVGVAASLAAAGIAENLWWMAGALAAGGLWLASLHAIV